jgi:hypothetical protein
MNYTIPYILNKKLKEYKFNKKFFEELRIFVLFKSGLLDTLPGFLL